MNGRSVVQLAACGQWYLRPGRTRRHDATQRPMKRVCRTPYPGPLRPVGP